MSTTTSTRNGNGNGQRRRRPHPARRARRIVGAAGVSGLVVLTGAMTMAAQDASSAGTAVSTSATATSARSTGAVAAAPQQTAVSHSKGS